MSDDDKYDWKKRLRRNIAHVRLPEHAPLIDRFVDPAFFGLVVQYQVSDDSPVVRYEGFFRGLDMLANDFVRCALVPGRHPEVQSAVALHVPEGLFRLIEHADRGLDFFSSDLCYCFMRRAALDTRLSAEVHDRATAYLTQYSEKTQRSLKEVLEQSERQDDSRAYTGEVWMEEWFGETHALVRLTTRANLLLNATEQRSKGVRFSSRPVISPLLRSELRLVMNRGLKYLCDAASLPPFEGQGANLLLSNLDSYFCMMHQSKHLLPATRTHVEALVEEVVLLLAGWLTIEEFDEDTLYYLGHFAEYTFLDLYWPDIVAELQACRDQWLRLRDEQNRLYENAITG